MKQSAIKTVIKITLITFGLLSFTAGILNPLIYFFGTETTASFDSISYTETEDGAHESTAEYHYYASAKEYTGSVKIEDKDAEALQFNTHKLKYLPLFPSYSVLLTGYTLPLNSIILIAIGFLSFITGLLLKGYSIEKQPKPDNTSEKVHTYICPACECEIDKDSIFCNYCGRKLLKKG